MSSIPLPMRPHHGLCLQFFVGKGYSPEFTAHMSATLGSLAENPAQLLRLVCRTDHFCTCCPHNQSGLCESGQKVDAYDQSVLSLCGLAEHQELSWQEFQALVSLKIISPGKQPQVCAGCQWAELCQEVSRQRFGR